MECCQSEKVGTLNRDSLNCLKYAVKATIISMVNKIHTPNNVDKSDCRRFLNWKAFHPFILETCDDKF